MSNRIVAAVKAEIASLLEAHGDQITPQQLVEYARNNPDSALYHSFTWDDAEAAAKWRLEQAQALLRNYMVRIEGPDETPIVIRGVVSLPSERGPQHLYRSTIRVMNDEGQMAELLEAAKRELHSFRIKYAMLQKASKMTPLFEAIDEALSKAG